MAAHLIGIASRLLVIGLVVGGAVVAAPIVAAGGGCHSTAEQVPAEGSATTVTLDGCTFSPTIDWVPLGAEVRFVNLSNAYHDVTGRMYAWGSEQLESGASYTHRFTAPGLYPYSCSLHPGMAGVVVVADVASAEAAGPVVEAPSADQDGAVDRSATSIAPAVAVGGLVVLIGLAGFALLRRRDLERAIGADLRVP